MTILVRNLNNVGGAASVTDVSDNPSRGTLNPAGKLFWGFEYQILSPITNPIGIGNPFCTASGMVLSGLPNGNTATYLPSLIPCIGLTFGKVNGLAQHCQFTFQSILNAVAIACGAAVMMTINGQSTASWYGFNFSQGGTPFLERCSVASNILTTNTLFTAPAGQVAGDVWRLSFDPSTNIVTLIKNGVTLFNSVDASPLSGGIPGLQIRTANSSAGSCNQVVLTNIDCGLGI